MPNWSQRTWLITGAAAGFGRALAHEVLARGGRVIATARNPAGFAPLPTAAPDRLLVLPLDVSDPAAIQSAMARAEAFGGVDVLVNNAGYGLLGGIEESTDGEVRAQFETNFFGAAAMIRAVLPGMRARGGGTIVNISSVAGATGGPGAGYYSASKFALEGLSESLAVEAAPLGIRVLIVEPGAFRTGFFGRSMATPAHRVSHYKLVDATLSYAAANDGTQAGDPARAATTIVDTLDRDDPPQRLVLGAGACEIIETALRARLAEAGEQRELALAACFPEHRRT
jgi:NAD(P)-dependent dehydrogenase (short-subunit alcohol dehydrogenase family)